MSALAFYGMYRINEVLSIKRGDVLLYQRRASTDKPGEIEFGTYVLPDRKTEVAEGRAYNLHSLDSSERAIDAYDHVNNWITFMEGNKNQILEDDDFLFPALAKVSRKALKKRNADGKLQSIGCENASIGWGKKVSEQVFITVLNYLALSLNKNGVKTEGYLKRNWSNIWFTSHTFRRVGAQYRFMYAVPEKRWSLRMIKW